MSIQAQGAYANVSTIYTSILNASLSPPPIYSTLNIKGGSRSSPPIPQNGLILTPDTSDRGYSNPIFFFHQGATDKDTGIPMLRWSDYTSSLNLTAYSTVSNQYQDLTVRNMYLGITLSFGPPGPAQNSVPIGGDGMNAVTIPFSSIAGISTINGTNWAAMVAKVSTLAG